ncbi:MAG: DUF493 domain-containing protein [Gammaproteobacteria bacterium]|nr:DUF493 domain-containing protein [Gammaproteobacteria bacterium]
MTDAENKPLIEFPCEFPVKIMGKAHEDFHACVNVIFSRHVPDFHEGQIKVRPSGKGNYSAITVTIEAQSQEQLDKIYIELSDHELVLMAL